MRERCGAEQDGVPPDDLIENEGLSEDTGELGWMAPRMAIVVDAIRNAEPPEAGAKVSEGAPLPSWSGRAAHDPANHPTREPIEKYPAILVRLLVKKIQDLGDGRPSSMVRIISSEMGALARMAAINGIPTRPSVGEAGAPA